MKKRSREICSVVYRGVIALVVTLGSVAANAEIAEDKAIKSGGGKIATIVSIFVDKSKHEEFEKEVVQSYKGSPQKASGVLESYWFFPTKEQMPYRHVSVWESMEHFNAYYARAFEHRRRSSSFEYRPPLLEIYSVPIEN